MLLGVRAVIAESFERIHRSNLVGMGVLPVQFAGRRLGGVARPDRPGDVRHPGIAGGVTPKQDVHVEVTREDGSTFAFVATARIDAPAEVEYFRHGGILRMVLRQMLAAEKAVSRRPVEPVSFRPH